MKPLLASIIGLLSALAVQADSPKLKVLFLGDAGHHAPKARYRQLEPVMAKRGVELTYTDSLKDITADGLKPYDGLAIFANIDRGPAEVVTTIRDYVAGGKGFIPIHCASFCFTDNKDYIELVGAQFRSHITGVFRTIQKDAHEITKGSDPFESWDETYVHHKHNAKDRTVLEVRMEGQLEEPWTWVRTHGKGRVFYTAWGHDHRTWSHDGFHTLLERGMRWACGHDLKGISTYTDAPKMTKIDGPKADFEFVEAKIPFYPKSDRWGVTADPIATMQKPLPPEKSVKHYTVPEGFALELFASDDQFGGKPLTMTWDERGRLWVSVTKDYPNEMQKKGEGRDKIVILEDTDGDGKADKRIEFADKLSIPTSLLCVRGGVIVHQAPETLFLKDTDGDGKADVRQVLLSGWDTYDTHAGPSNLRYGFDNWIYGMVGYAGFNGTVNGEKLNFKQGLYRFRLVAGKDGIPSVEKLEFLRNVNNNAWGVAFNEDGELFGSTANGCPLVNMAIPNRYYEKMRGASPGALPNIALDNRYHPVTKNVRQVDWHGGFTSAAGCAIYTARNYPQEYWNRTAFVSDPTGHLTATFVLQPNESSYVARYGWNLAASQDEWAAPIDAQVGPDGNVWILDWYNYIVQHNPTPAGFKNGKGNAYETEARDKSRGRVYRLVYTKAKVEKTPNLSEAKPEKLVEMLKHDNLFWRLTAQRLLVEGGKGELKAALEAPLDAASPTSALHTLWVLAGLGGFENPGRVLSNRILDLAKKAPPAVQRALLDSLPPDSPLGLATISTVLRSSDAKTRLHALLALSDCPPQTGTTSYGLLELWAGFDAASDRNMNDALLMATVPHAEGLLSAMVDRPTTLPTASTAALTRAYTAYAGAKRVHDVTTLLKNLVELKDTSARNAILAGLSAGWSAGKSVELSPSGEKAFVKLLAEAEATQRSKLLKLAGTWNVKGLEGQLTELTKGLLVTLADAKATDAARLEAAKQAVELLPADENAAEAIVAALSAKASPELARGLCEVLGASKAKRFGTSLVAKLGTLPNAIRPVALGLVLARPEASKAYLDAVEKGTLRFDLLALDQKTALAAHPDKAIAERAKKILAAGGGLPDANRQKVIDDYREVLTKDGDAGSGKKLFIQHCAKCHKHGGEGAQIGPDLTGFAVHPKEEILIHVLDPSRSVEGNYRAVIVKLLDGRVATGLLASETKTGIEIVDAENKRQAISREDIDVQEESKKSLMPEGFEKDISKPQMIDLLAFLSQKGKYLPIPLDKAATIVTTRGMFFKENGEIERLVFEDWKPKEFAGVPFVLVDPNGDKTKNAVMLYGKNGDTPPKMPKSVTLPCNTSAKAIHILGGIGGWNFPATAKGTLTMTVRLHYADGKTEDHELKNGVHFADYIGKVDVPESKYAFKVRNQQVRYLSIAPKRSDKIEKIELVKGTDDSAPITMAITIETE